MSFIQRLRAGAVIGVCWGISWAAAGVALMTWRVFLGSPRVAHPSSIWPMFAVRSGLVLAAFGVLSGLTFARAVTKTARRRGLGDLSQGFAARWGAIAGASSIVVAPLLGVFAAPALIVGAAVLAFVGVGSAVATLGIAHRTAMSPCCRASPTRQQPNVRCSSRAI